MAPQGEVAATCAAFDQEFSRNLTHLLARKKAPQAQALRVRVCVCVRVCARTASPQSSAPPTSLLLH